MTSLVDTNILQQIAGSNTVGASAGIGKVGAPGQGLDFVSLILAQLQDGGQNVQSLEGQSGDDLKATLSAIISELTNTVSTQVNGSENSAQSILQSVANTSNTNTNTNTDTNAGVNLKALNGLLNNPILAQQLGLNPETASDAEIVTAIQDALSEIGIEINSDTLKIGEQGFTHENKVEAAPAKDTPAHLNTLNSPQETAQNASSVSQNATDDTSPLNAQASLAASPNADQNNVAETGAEEAIFTTKNNSILQALRSAQDETQQLLNANGQSASVQASGAAQKNAKAPIAGNSNNKGAVPQSTAGSLPASPQNTSSPKTGVQVATQTSASPNFTANTSPLAGGTDSSPEFLIADDAANTFTSSADGFDSDALNHFRQENLNSTTAKHATQHSTGTRYNGSQAQVVRATLLSVTRGADNAIDRMSLQLEPAELGRIDVELKMGKDGMLKASIMTDKADTLNILQKDSSALQKALQDAGLDVGSDSFSFDLRDQNNGQLAQDKDSREMLFNIEGLEDISEDANGINDNYAAASAYGQTYANASGVNIFV